MSAKPGAVIHKPIFGGTQAADFFAPLQAGSAAPGAQDTIDIPLDAIDTSSDCCGIGRLCTFFYDCVAGFCRFILWLLSCCGCCSSKDEETDELPSLPIATPSLQPPSHGESKSSAVPAARAPAAPPQRPVTVAYWSSMLNQWLEEDKHIPAFTWLPTIARVQERWHALTFDTTTFVIAALQVRSEQKPYRRWMMQVGVIKDKNASPQLRIALKVFYAWVAKSFRKDQLQNARFEYTLACFSRRDSSKQTCECHVDAMVLKKGKEITRETNPIVRDLLIKNQKFPDAVKKGTLLMNRMLARLDSNIIMSSMIPNHWVIPYNPGPHGCKISLSVFEQSELKK